LEQQKAERDNMVEQQKLEVAKAYHQQQTELKQQDLEQKEQMIQDKIRQAAQQQMAFERFRSDIAGGMPAADAALKNLANPSILSTAIREKMKPADDNGYSLETAYTDQGDFPFLRTAKGAIHVLTPPKEASTSLQQISQAMKNLPLQKRALGTNYSAAEASLSKLYKEKLDSLSGKEKSATPESPAQGGINILPFPQKGKEVKGALYYTPKGVLQFDGERFVAPSPQASADTEQSDTEVADVPEKELDSENA